MRTSLQRQSSRVQVEDAGFAILQATRVGSLEPGLVSMKPFYNRVYGQVTL